MTIRPPHQARAQACVEHVNDWLSVTIDRLEHARKDLIDQGPDIGRVVGQELTSCARELTSLAKWAGLAERNARRLDGEEVLGVLITFAEAFPNPEAWRERFLTELWKERPDLNDEERARVADKAIAGLREASPLPPAPQGHRPTNVTPFRSRGGEGGAA